MYVQPVENLIWRSGFTTGLQETISDSIITTQYHHKQHHDR